MGEFNKAIKNLDTAIALNSEAGAASCERAEMTWK
jgi:hypothetical protein